MKDFKTFKESLNESAKTTPKELKDAKIKYWQAYHKFYKLIEDEKIKKQLKKHMDAIYDLVNE